MGNRCTKFRGLGSLGKSMQLIQGGEPIVNYSGSIGFGRIIDGKTDVFCFLNSQDRWFYHNHCIF